MIHASTGPPVSLSFANLVQIFFKGIRTMRKTIMLCGMMLQPFASGCIAQAYSPSPIGLGVGEPERPTVFEQDAASFRRRVLRTLIDDGGALTPQHLKQFQLEKIKLDRERSHDGFEHKVICDRLSSSHLFSAKECEYVRVNTVGSS